jgi:hypothetical protein
MEYKNFLFGLCLSLYCGLINAATDSKVCSNPSAPCQSEAYIFEDYELSFKLPKQLTWLNTYQSESFYAILLKSIRAEGDCKYVAERERLEVQAMFPERKVFASHNGCNDISPDMLSYTNTNADHNFLALYAGRTLAEAEQFLPAVKKHAQFSDANIRKMQVELYYGD